MLLFKYLDLNSKNEFERYTKNKYENSETSFANMFVWRDYFNVKYALFGGYLIVVYTDTDGSLNAYMPYGDGELKPCIDEMIKYFDSCGQKLKIVSASFEMSEKIRRLYSNVTITENVNFNDYIYKSESLITLSGKKLHSKKNHLNYFKNNYKYEYRDIEKRDYNACIELASQLMLKTRDAESLSYKAEYRSIENTFNNFDALGLCGGVIEIDGEIAAFSVGERLTDDCAVIHIEKADTSYRGIYAAINNEFVKNRWSGVKFINREEDMGLEGLRKAKMSYRPDHMVRKFICEFN